MCLNVARMTDIAIGICCGHPPIPCIPWIGVIISGSLNTYCNNLKVARVGDDVMGCHRGKIVSGSAKTFVNNKQMARITDSVAVGPPRGIIISGSPNTFSG